MSTNKKPRKKYRQRYLPAGNTMAIAMEGASVPSQADIDQIMTIIHKCHKALREGVATMGQWSILAGAAELGRQIERQGTVRGLDAYITSAHNALQSVFQRSNTGTAWRQSPLYFYELDAISTFIELHTFQIRQLSRSEIEDAVNKANCAAQGQHTHVEIVRDLERMAA